MKRVRGNGGARTALQPEGIVILGQFKSHAKIAKLGLEKPSSGESIASGLASTAHGDSQDLQLEGKLYSIARERDPGMTKSGEVSDGQPE